MLDVLTEMSDMLVADPDADRLLQWVTGQCLRRLDVQAAGILPADHGGALRALAVAPESASRVRLFEAAPAPGT